MRRPSSTKRMKPIATPTPMPALAPAVRPSELSFIVVVVAGDVVLEMIDAAKLLAVVVSGARLFKFDVGGTDDPITVADGMADVVDVG